MKTLSTFAIPALAAVVLTLSFAACEEKKGPLERAGESADEAVEESTDAVKDATN